MASGRWGWLLVVLGLAAPLAAHAQLDPVERRLIQLGYNQPIQGREPLAGYAFFYYNEPNFWSTNQTLRLAIAPVYLDGELGFKQLLGPQTDVGLGFAGGFFGDSYSEFNQGKFEPKQSFWGDGGEISGSIYHLFNPNQRIPLTWVERVGLRRSFYREDSDTADNFELPEDRTTVRIRSGLRFGGQEPSLTEPLAMELSVWHEAQIRLQHDRYGFNDDRKVDEQAQLLWGRALFKFTFERSEQMVDISITSGTSWDTDRFSAYRLGGLLPFSSEFPLSLPGYFFQELSAKSFALLNASYSFPLSFAKSWRFDILGAGAWVDYLPGMEQPGDLQAGLGGGFTYISSSGSWLASLIYGHGFEAIRSHGRGADQIAFLFQYDFEAKARGKSRFFVPAINRYR